ncbi:MAG: cysteine desulfurase family protein [Opitutales bacterium]
MRYFDYNATAPLLPEARQVWLEALEVHWHNPDSPHGPAARAHARLEEARERLAALLDTVPESIVFTSGATEANNAVLADAAAHALPQQRVLVSTIEHPCVLEPARQFFGPDRCALLPVDAQGRADLTVLEAELARGDLALVALMAANNETGVIQPWAEAIELCQANGVPLLIDAAQWLGKRPAAGLCAADYVTASAHKFGGPLGVGLMHVPAARHDFAGLRGGDQEKARRAGTSNYPAIAGLVAALEAMECRIANEHGIWLERRESFERAVLAGIPEARVLGHEAERLPGTVSLKLPRADNLRWVRLLDRRGFALSTGSACATAKEGPSQVLAAMGLNAEDARQVVRVSAGPDTSTDDWQALAQALIETANELRQRQSADAARSSGSRVISI